MSLRKGIGLSAIIVISGLFWFSYVIFTSGEKNPNFYYMEQKDQEVVYYKLHQARDGMSIPASVYLDGQQILTFTQSAGGLSPRERAVSLVRRLNEFVHNSGDPNKIFPGFHNSIAVGKYDNEILFTADVKSARSLGISVSELALLWANNIRGALGSTELLQDYELLKLIAEKCEKTSKYRETGIASWYGGYFHGRTAADGSTYDMYKFTAAHKSLPFGSIVKVTNLRNNDSCVVKITDRGPFIEGRIIDLSKVAAEEIGVLDPGTTPVEIEVLGRV